MPRIISAIDRDIVLFRRFPDGDVIALFPYLPACALNSWYCMSYMHIGQHGAADPRIVYDTRPARPREYAALKAELIRIGYRLAIRRRIPLDAHARRSAALGSIPPVSASA
jgi:hypothetical protein